MSTDAWYEVNHPELFDTPALLVFKDRVSGNIDKMIGIAGNPARLIPHVKTHKMQEVVAMQIEKGIRRFKCSTISEAEMTARAGASAILIAYQLNEPKVDRYLELVRAFPRVVWSSLVDNIGSAKLLQERFAAAGLTASVFLDLDTGMHRTGVAPGAALDLVGHIKSLPDVRILGLHAYDGHIREGDFNLRKSLAQDAIKSVWVLAAQMKNADISPPLLIAGGTPSFTVHALQKELLCSPGTCLLWDHGYGQLLKEQTFLPAAVLMTRVVSIPAPGYVTTDLGHKSVSAENPLDKRVFFLNLQGYTVHAHSEEHLVLKVDVGKEPPIGTLLYGIPYHVCPSVALHDEARIIVDGEQIAVWPVIARRRKIDI